MRRPLPDGVLSRRLAPRADQQTERGEQTMMVGSGARQAPRQRPGVAPAVPSVRP